MTKKGRLRRSLTRLYLRCGDPIDQVQEVLKKNVRYTGICRPYDTMPQWRKDRIGFVGKRLTRQELKEHKAWRKQMKLTPSIDGDGLSRLSWLNWKDLAKEKANGRGSKVVVEAYPSYGL